MVDDAQTRTREIENRLEVDKDREERIIGQLADARELLTTHLAATQTGLQRVLTEVSEAAIPDLIEPGEAPVDEVPAGDDEEPDGP